jgi:hypothetical protein
MLKMPWQHALPNANHSAIFFLSLSILAYQVLLSRLFSVAISNLFALVALAISMLGLALGALLYSKWQSRQSAHWQTPFYAYAFTLLLQIIAFLALPQFMPAEYANATQRLAAMAALIPFMCAGLALAELLFRPSDAIAGRYAIDLAGAAAGCIVISALQQWLPPQIIAFALSALIVAAGLFTSATVKNRGLIVWVAISTAFIGCLMFFPSMFNMSSLKAQETPALYEKWNNFSYVRVLPYTQPSRVLQKLSPPTPIEGFKQLYIDIDGKMGALLTNYGNNPANLEYLKDEISNLAYHVREPHSVALIGIGGGIDVLSAMAFKTPSIIGIELNPIVLDIVTRQYAEFTGHLDKQPGVTLVRAEGRSWLKTHPEHFDAIRMAIVPVWASGAAISNTVMQNKLLTVEAWSEMLEKLTDKGILSVTRTLFPNELDRLKRLAVASLIEQGIQEKDCNQHTLILVNDVRATALVSKSPFTSKEVARFEAYAERTGGQIALAPHLGWNHEVFTNALNTPPSDNTPFYTAALNFEQLLNALTNLSQFQPLMLYAVFPLSFASFLMYLAVLIQRRKFRQANSQPIAPSATLYFTLTAGGFMLIEIMLMYQIMVFMPEPSDALCVVLFTLLVSGSAGSYVSARRPAYYRYAQWLMPIILLLTAAAYPSVSEFASASPYLIRTASVVALLLPAGFLMGIMFPAGMQRWNTTQSGTRAWLFAVNCAFSAFMSSAALILVASGSISGTYLIGVLCYAAAGCVYFYQRREAVIK